MTICFFTNKLEDGSGDVVQTVKIADFVKKFAASHLGIEEIIIVVPETEIREALILDHKATTQYFVNEISPGIPVINISEFKKNIPKIDAYIQAGYGLRFSFEEALDGQILPNIPIIYMPEYNNELVPASAKLIIKGGFNIQDKNMGVIPNQYLLDATQDSNPSLAKLQEAFELIDPKLKKYLGKNFEEYLRYRNCYELAYQYSHDRITYTPYSDPEEEKPHQESRTATQFFLNEHRILRQNSSCSQDVLCLGEKAKTKKAALLKIKDSLIQSGYSKITFINLEEETEEVLYQSPSLDYQKEYRMFYCKSVPFSTMQALALLATDLVGVTGDNSLVEAMSAKKLISYECIYHKRSLVEEYLKDVATETTNSKVLELARFLMKRDDGHSNVFYNENEITVLLNDKEVVEGLKNINRTLITKSHYFNELTKILTQHIIPRAKLQEAFEPLDPKLKKYLGNNFAGYLMHRDSHKLAFQHSDDKIAYPIYQGFSEKIPIKSCTPAQLFLNEHKILSKSSSASQDVICLGERAETKKAALLEIKDSLIKNGYSKIAFINVDEETEELIYESPSSNPPKEYRVLYTRSVSSSTLQHLILLSNDFVGITGTDSLLEAMSAKKLISYECTPNNRTFVAEYLNGVSNETDNEKVHFLAKFLMKETDSKVFYVEGAMAFLLNNEKVVEELKNINRTLSTRSHYFQELKKMQATTVCKPELEEKPLYDTSSLALTPKREFEEDSFRFFKILPEKQQVKDKLSYSIVEEDPAVFPPCKIHISEETISERRQWNFLCNRASEEF